MIDLTAVGVVDAICSLFDYVFPLNVALLNKIVFSFLLLLLLLFMPLL